MNRPNNYLLYLTDFNHITPSQPWVGNSYTGPVISLGVKCLKKVQFPRGKFLTFPAIKITK